MEPWLFAVLFRFLERIVAVLIGGLTIYIGYRLFLEVPQSRNQSGKVELPWNISIVMTRVGPGTFFALFGVVVLWLSLLKPMVINPDGTLIQSPHVVHYQDNVDLGVPITREDARALLRREMIVLNTLPGKLREDLPEFERGVTLNEIRSIKLALMKPVWGEASEGFGDYTVFERWVRSGEPEPVPPGMEGALGLYRYKG